MKTILQRRGFNVPDGIDSKVQEWMRQNTAQDANDKKILEDEFSKIALVKKWTPVLTFTTVGDLSVTYSVQLGDLIRTKDGIVATFNIVTSAFTWSTSSGALNITGLPYTASLASADSGMVWTGAMFFQGITKASYTQFNPVMTAGSSVISIVGSGSGQSAATLQAADFPTGGTVVLKGSIPFRIRS